MYSGLGLDFGLTPIARLRQNRQTRMFREMACRNVQLGTETVLTHSDPVNLCGCSIGDGTKIGPFFEIHRDRHLGCSSSSASIICGITVGRFALIGAGAVATRDVPDYAIVAGVPAKVVGDGRDREDFLTTATRMAAL
jgi:acetyltransferase-like isoleucine patch superfamily enzyme